MNKVSGVFFDRDGTICVDVGYLKDPNEVELLKRSADAIRLLNERKIPIVVVTNQSGVSRGYFPEETIHKANKRLEELLAKENVYVDAIYYCPHHPDGGCHCRKPEPGMVEEGAKKLNINVKKSFVVGDKATDVELGQNVGAKTILLLTGYGEEEKGKSKPDYIVNDLYDAVQIIIKEND
jgi:D-glycero-D-manno-heptose 1,7-bisphosphate phosphatase